MPKVLFAKAWVTTGHVSKSEMMERANISEEQWQSCHLRPDPAGFLEVLGLDAMEEPSVEEMIANAERKRTRVVWLVSCLDNPAEMAILPASLVYPIEKRLSHHLYCKANSQDAGKLSTIIISKRAAREMYPEMVKKYTKIRGDGTREFKEDVPKRTLKDILGLKLLTAQIGKN